MALGPPRFLTRRYLGGAQVYASGSAAALGVANLLDEDRTMLWRADSASEAYVDLDLGEIKPVNCIAMIQHNLSYDGGLEIRAGAAQGGGELMTVAYDAWEPLWGGDESPADEHDADGFPTDEERAKYFPAGTMRLIYLDQLVLPRWLRVYLHGPTWADEYNPTGLIQAGIVIPGCYFEADRRVSAPLPLGPEETSKLDYAEGGQVWVDEGARFRGGQYKFDNSAAGVALGGWYDLLQEVGVGKHLVADLFPGAISQVLRIRNQFYCHLTKFQRISLDRMVRGGLALEIRESN